MTNSAGLVKSVPSDIPLHQLLRHRWSPRGFTGQEVTDDRLYAILQAGRWTMSASNSQPWRFIVGRRDTDVFQRIRRVLAESNEYWAREAGVLIIMCAETENEEGNERRWAVYDTGQAAAMMTVQAESLGLSVHQMGGFDADATRDEFDLPDAIRPIAVMAIGHYNPQAVLREHHQSAEGTQRTRLPLEDLVLYE